jgi:tetratricopeptide (TPR) repeat protein
MMDVMGTVYFNLGLDPQAESLLARALDIRRRALGPEHRDTLSSLSSLAKTLDEGGRYADAEKLEREAVGIQRRILGPEHPDTLNSVNNLANILNDERQYPEAEKLNREVFESRRHVLGPDTGTH